MRAEVISGGGYIRLPGLNRKGITTGQVRVTAALHQTVEET